MNRDILTFVAPYQLKIDRHRLPPPAAGQVLVRTALSALSSGTELLIYRGQQPEEMLADETIPALQGDLSYPLQYGYASVGKVVQVGPQVDTAWLDRRVFAFQPHASAFLESVTQVFPVPTDLDLETAVFLPTMETAVNFMLDGQPVVGERVVVFGQGVVGLLTCALLSFFPLDRLVSLDRLPARRSLSLAFGAHASIDPIGADASQAVVDALGGPADLVYELSGEPATIDQAIGVAGFAGRIVIGSWYGRKRAPLELGGHFHRNRLTLISSQVSTLAPHSRGRWDKNRRLALAWRLLPQVNPARLITHRVPFSRAQEAYHLLDQSSDRAVQIVLTYD